MDKVKAFLMRLTQTRKQEGELFSIHFIRFSGNSRSIYVPRIVQNIHVQITLLKMNNKQLGYVI